MLIFINCRYVFGKPDTTRYISLDYNLIQGLLDEHVVTFEYKPFIYHSFSVSIGQLFPHGPHEGLKGVSPSQEVWPFFVYKGSTIRLGYYFNIKFFEEFKWYIGPQFVYKKMFYRNESLTDSEGDWGEVTFVRSEDAYVLGGNLTTGFYVPIFSSKRVMYRLSCYAGCEYRYKYRKYTTLSSEAEGDCQNVPIGEFGEIQKYTRLILGIKLGIGFKY